MEKGIITVVGKDQVGIIAKVCTYLAENKLNILDISQTIIQGYFNMMMIIELNESVKQFGTICEELDKNFEHMTTFFDGKDEKLISYLEEIKNIRNQIKKF